MIAVTEVNTATRIVRRNSMMPLQELKTEICIVGAGLAGVSAALEAARLGHKVVLVDSLPALGGQAVNSIIGLFCGLFSLGPNPYQFTHGIADDILRDLGAAGALHYRRGAWTSVMYDELALSRWIEKAIRTAGVTAILGGVVSGVARQERRISSLEIATRYGELRITAQAFVDASGDAVLAWKAGLPCREPDIGPVYGSQIIVLEGVDSDKQPTREELADRQKEKAGDYGMIRKDGFAFFFPAKGTALVNMTHVATPLDPVDATVSALEGKDQADAVVGFLKKEYPLAFGRARIRAYGLTGIRQTRWIVGRQQLTVEDVRAGTRFADAIARTAWAIELHDRPEGYVWEPFAEEHVHYVPFGSLTPPDTDNLVAIGRCIDGDLAALSSVRVHGPCIAMGAAAAHALDLAGSGSVHEIDMDALQERVKDNVVRTD